MAQRVDGFARTTGEHLDATVGEVARVARDAELLGTLTGARAIEHALYASRDETTTCDQGDAGLPADSATRRASTALARASSASSRAVRCRPAAGAIRRPAAPVAPPPSARARASRRPLFRPRARPGGRCSFPARARRRTRHAIAQSTSSSQAANERVRRWGVDKGHPGNRPRTTVTSAPCTVKARRPRIRGAARGSWCAASCPHRAVPVR